ncbi:hypothetical protein FIA58_012280 [Flavobacterium jejuense]|uniref:Anti-sigma factor n=1 Tax=Flavobacterium jejuense TaxID=1544455 RepID=A0ABX0ITK0_9FLAO|nr:hypothetical protein [Flavobacterium jejuense]NHN26455.1 hypothetical protein [Flavobacterium jejuense]
MAPNKMDTKIRQQLASREIKPSEQAWDRLDAMLSVGEIKKKKNYSWMYIAASFILFSSVGFWFYNQDDSKINIDKNKVVTTEEKADTLQFHNIIKKTESNYIEKETVIVDNSEFIQPIKESKTIKIEKELNPLVNEKQSQKSVVQNIEVENIEPSIEKTTKNRYITGETLLAAIENRPIEKKQVLNNEVSSKVRVNTSSLLTSVEKELDEDHKETTIDRLTRNFKQVKSALANRNYEE